MTILDGATAVTSIPVADVNLQNDITLTTLEFGTHTLTAQYGGAQDYAAITSTPLVVTVVAPPDFAVTSTATAATVAPGQSATLSLTFTPSIGTGPITLSCSGLPALAHALMHV